MPTAKIHKNQGILEKRKQIIVINEKVIVNINNKKGLKTILHVQLP